MDGGDWHVAQVNVARLLAPLDSPQLAGFVELLDPINRIADASPGFVWRLQTDAGDSTGVPFGHDDRIVVNLTVWRSLEALEDFAYASRHAGVLRRKKEWFARMAQAHLAVWWIPTGSVPTIAEAEERLAYLREHGPTTRAFTLRVPFGPPGAEDLPSRPIAPSRLAGDRRSPA